MREFEGEIWDACLNCGRGGTRNILHLSELSLSGGINHRRLCFLVPERTRFTMGAEPAELNRRTELPN
jgi:hypothetical protein